MLLSHPVTVAQLAAIAGAEFSGSADIVINSLNNIAEAGPGELSFYADAKYEKFLAHSAASCLIVPIGFDSSPGPGRAYIFSPNPYQDFVRVALELHKDTVYPPGIAPTASVGPGTVIDPSAHVAANCSIGSGCSLGAGVVILANTTIYDQVSIGPSTMIHSNVVICRGSRIGSQCIIHPGAVIGSDGFGYTELPDGSFTKIPQLGNVILGDRVEIGANTTIDRAMIGSTVIEDGVKLDNLIHIGHNVRVGENSAMAAQTGVSGSTRVGRRNRFGGQVGLAGHIDTADDVTLYAQSGVAKSVDKKGAYFGTPIKDRLLAFKIEAALKQLPQLVNDVARMKKLLGDNQAG